MIVRAFPVLPGKENEAVDFAREVGTRTEETASFLQNYGVRRETWHLQRTAHGAVVIVITDIQDSPLERAAAYGSSQARYERWFKDRIRELSGIDPDSQPLGPPTETIFSFDGTENRRKTFDAPA
jgi:hypothetical protein